MRPLRPAVALATAVALLATGCSSDDGTTAVETVAAREVQPLADAAPEAPDAEPDAPAPATSATSASAVSPAPAPSVPATPVEVPDEVDVVTPDLLVHSAPLAARDVDEALGLDGVEALAATSGFSAELGIDDRSRIVDVLAVDPSTFRPLTPAVTAQAPGVWQRLMEGDVLVRHDLAHELDLPLGGYVVLTGPTGTRSVRIGAFASNGAPPVADVIVPWSLGTALGAPGINRLVVAASDGADPGELGESMVAAIGSGDVEVRTAPKAQEAKVVSTGRVQFEPFGYTSLGDGLIVIDPDWVRRWIVTVDLPRVGATRVHRMMAPQLLAALEQIEAEGLIGHFKPEQFGGGWVPRHIDWNPAKPLSMHAWGLAVDFNTRDNWLGQTPQMDRRIVEIFESWGFEWGGRWSRPDGMHFELDRVVDVER